LVLVELLELPLVVVEMVMVALVAILYFYR
jgi:hypothetical protein